MVPWCRQPPPEMLAYSKLSLKRLARAGETAEKEPELEGEQPQRSPAAAWETKLIPALAHAL